MGIFAEFTDKHGRRCVVHDGRGGLGEVLANYEECGAESPDDEDAMTEHAIHPTDTVIFARPGGGHEEVEASALSRKAAGDMLDRLTQQELARHPGMPYAKAFERVTRVNGDLVRAYTHTAATARDIERATTPPADSEVVIQDGAARYHIHGGPIRAHGSINRSDLLAPPAGIVIRWGPDFASMGQRPEQVVFDKALFPHKGLAEGFLVRVGLVASAWREEFNQFIATIFTGDAPSPDRVQYAQHEELPKAPGLVGSYTWPDGPHGPRRISDLVFSKTSGWTRQGSAAYVASLGLGEPVQVEEDEQAVKFIFVGHPSGVVPQ